MGERCGSEKFFLKEIKKGFLQRRVSWGSHIASSLLIPFTIFVTNFTNLRTSFYDAGVTKPHACQPSIVIEILVAFHNSSPTLNNEQLYRKCDSGNWRFCLVFLQTTTDRVCKVTTQSVLQLRVSLLMFFK
jgi:hypothetical protein